MKPVDAHLGTREVRVFSEADTAALGEAEGIATRPTRATAAATCATPRAIVLGVTPTDLPEVHRVTFPHTGPATFLTGPNSSSILRSRDTRDVATFAGLGRGAQTACQKRTGRPACLHRCRDRRRPRRNGNSRSHCRRRSRSVRGRNPPLGGLLRRTTPMGEAPTKWTHPRVVRLDQRPACSVDPAGARGLPPGCR
jgi:hypothetical protein